jgi:hypothetical protein
MVVCDGRNWSDLEEYRPSPSICGEGFFISAGTGRL